MTARRDTGLSGSQALFWDPITAPEGVARGARELAERGRLGSPDLSFFVEPSDRMTPTERLDIYGDMYFYRLRDSLAEDFPKVVATVGGSRFHNLVTDFLLVHPSVHPSLRYLGVPMPDYLATHELGRAFPYLADLARLEWARIEVFDETDAEPLTREGLQAMAPQKAQEIPLDLVPACRLLELEWTVAPLWRRIDETLGAAERRGTNSAAAESEDGFTEPFPVEEPPPRRPSCVRAWRRDFGVYHRTMAGDEARCLRLLQEGGASLSRLAEALLESGPDPSGPASDDAEPTDRATRRLAALMDLWLQDGLIKTPGDEPNSS